MALSIMLVFSAGFLSFFTPCVIPIVPGYISYLSGIREHQENNLKRSITNGVFFTLGFSIVFILFGFSFTYLGNLFYEYKKIIAKVGGLIIIIFGLQMTGLFRLRFLNFDTRFGKNFPKKHGILFSLLLGILFSFGWSPCIGPVLGSILTTLASSNLEPITGGTLLAVYSFGLSIPFLAASLGMGWLNKYLVIFKNTSRVIEVVAGTILILTGLLLFSGYLNLLSTFGNNLI